MADDRTVLEVRDLETTFAVRSPLLRRQVGEVNAVSGVSFKVSAGEGLGLVGESGCGKSTVARTLVGLERPRRGRILLNGVELTPTDPASLRHARREIQLIFQDPYSALNPRMTVRELIVEGWRTNPGVVPHAQWRSEADDLLDRVGLDRSLADRRPRQLSGGQRQRVCIARALAVRPKLIICDEAVSALDVSIRSQILNLLRKLQRDSGVAYLFISHDLGVVRYLCQRVAVMYLGRIVEQGPRDVLYHAPQHPYTQALLSAAPTLRPWEASGARQQIVLGGDVPSPLAPPSGCRFRTRCWRAQDRCADEQPLLREVDGRIVACHFPGPDEPGGQSSVVRPRLEAS